MKIGVFGGTFNPPHLGHTNAALTVMRKTGLDRLLVVPNFQNPLKRPSEGPTPEQRLKMTELAFQDYTEPIEIWDGEIQNTGKSYTHQTLAELQKKYPNDELFCILGVDNFMDLDRWQKPDQLLKLANWIVTSRPGTEMPRAREEMPACVRGEVAEMDFNFVELQSGKSIQFVTLEDRAVSSQDLRRKIRSGNSVASDVPLAVERYISDHGLYRELRKKLPAGDQFAHHCAGVLQEMKALNVQIFDLRKQQGICDFALVASGTSTRHVSAIAETLIRQVKTEFRVFPEGSEGLGEGRWALVDYGSVIVHVFYDFIRQEYSLEKLWTDATLVPLQTK